MNLSVKKLVSSTIFLQPNNLRQCHLVQTSAHPHLHQGFHRDCCHFPILSFTRLMYFHPVFTARMCQICFTSEMSQSIITQTLLRCQWWSLWYIYTRYQVKIKVKLCHFMSVAINLIIIMIISWHTSTVNKFTRHSYLHTNKLLVTLTPCFRLNMWWQNLSLFFCLFSSRIRAQKRLLYFKKIKMRVHSSILAVVLTIFKHTNQQTNVWLEFILTIIKYNFWKIPS